MSLAIRTPLWAILSFNGDGRLRLPCNPGGVSPSLPLASTCITGQLFTKQNMPPWCYSGLASLKRISTMGAVLRRVELSSPERSTKALWASRLRYLSLPTLQMTQPVPAHAEVQA